LTLSLNSVNTFTVCRDFNIFWSLLEKRKPYGDEFLYEKALKTDIYALRFALITVLKYINLIAKMVFFFKAVRFALLNILSEKG
jgi:hypothetical protein